MRQRDSRSGSWSQRDIDGESENTDCLVYVGRRGSEGQSPFSQAKVSRTLGGVGLYFIRDIRGFCMCALKVVFTFLVF